MRTNRLVLAWRRACEVARAREWWDFKLPPVLATAYATAGLLGLPLTSLWSLLALVLAASLPPAAYASLLNDLSDLHEDRVCGKPNRIAERSIGFRVAALTACVIPGVFAAWALLDRPAALVLYLAIWLVFTLYSLPPVRLKTRGLLGILADAAGAHLLPQLFAIAVIGSAAPVAVPVAWGVAVATWSLACGVRNILWHQFSDLSKDRQAGVATFAQRHSPQRLRFLGEWVVFPLELVGLGAMLTLFLPGMAWLLLGFYLALEAARSSCLGAQLIVVWPRPKYRIVLNEYYDVCYPLAVLLAAAWHHAPDAAVLAAHLVLFHVHTWLCGRDVLRVARRLVAKAIRRPQPKAA